MADDRDPPHLFNNVEIEQRDDDDNDDLFTSAIESVNFPLIVRKCMAVNSFSCRSNLPKTTHLWYNVVEYDKVVLTQKVMIYIVAVPDANRNTEQISVECYSKSNLWNHYHSYIRVFIMTMGRFLYTDRVR